MAMSTEQIQASTETDRDCWETPHQLFVAIDAHFHFTLDVCARRETAKVERFFSPEDDGLAQSWRGETCWCNPPYSNIAPWLRKAAHESIGGACTVVVLVPPWTDTRYWHEWASAASHMILLPGRVNFLLGGRPGNGNKTPSCLLVYGRPRWWHPWDEVPEQPRLSTWNWK